MALSLLPRRHATAGLPAELRKWLPPDAQVLGAVPVSSQGTGWLVATSDALVELEAEGMTHRFAWGQVNRASWDAGERGLTVELLHSEQTLVWRIPAVLVSQDQRGPARSLEVDERRFAHALRQRVESTIVHHVARVLDNGVRVVASVRRDEHGGLFSTTEPCEQDRTVAGCQDAVRALERQVRQDVGLPTR